MTAILGISAFFHDSAAALIQDGQLVAAAQEERFTRKKHDESFPIHAIEYCLQAADLHPRDIDYVGFYDKPLTKFERLLETSLSFAPRGYASFRLAIPRWLKRNLHLPREINEGLRKLSHGPMPFKRCVFLRHHESHAASAFFPSPFEEAAILTVDGVGEWHTTCIGSGSGNQIRLQRTLSYPHSLGMLYSAFTYYCGFRVNSGEYKLMGLAPYGSPRFRDVILERLIDLRDDGSFRLNMDYFDFAHGLRMTSRRFDQLFGEPPRRPEGPLTQHCLDLAASVQAVTEVVMLRLCRHAHQTTKQRNLVMAGGVALNCVANGRLLREGPFDQIWIQPAAGDAGGALGAASFIWHQLLGQPRRKQPSPTLNSEDGQHGSRLGPSFSEKQIEQALRHGEAVYERTRDDRELCECVAEAIDQQQVVGWFQGRMEFGPRALGGRSILADARSRDMQSTLNRKIKFRESFRPFAPIVLRERADQWFDLRGNDSPYMLIVADVTSAANSGSARSAPNASEVSARQHILTMLDAVESAIPAVTHVDRSARVQTVDSQRDPLLHRLLETFHQKTNCPVMVNTSFNVRSEPIVCTPEDALRVFLMTEMDLLAIGPFLLRKSAQRRTITNQDRDAFIDQFELD